MKKILVTIKKNSLILSFNYKIETETNDLLNTNIISDNKLIFSEEYINENIKIVGYFIKDIIDNNSINNIVLTNFEILYIIKEALNYICKVDTIIINDENNFTYEAYEIIVNSNKFNKVNCYSIPTYMIDLFDKNKIEVESRAEILYTSNFMEDNNLTSYSKIYYKSSLKIAPPMTAADVLDFESFIKINRYLKNIHLNACSLDAVDNLTKVLLNHRIKNINIIIHDNILKKEIIDELKKRKRILKKHNIYLDLRYTKEYVQKNFFKQLIITTLVICAIIVLIITSGCFAYIMLNNIESEKNVADISQRIEEKIANDNIQRENNKNEIIEPEEVNDGPKIIPKMASLLEMNDETVGWLTVPGTNINYPVVKTNNNDFYLDHNFDKKKDYNGWVFMNYLNNPTILDKNTILFAHNRFYSGVMFGTLNNLTKEKWYKEAKDLSIFFNNIYTEMEFEVISIYTINVTDDYLKINFESDEEFLSFVDNIKSRSIFKSDTKVDKDDKILTLSTCVENDKRLVVHALLRK